MSRAHSSASASLQRLTLLAVAVALLAGAGHANAGDLRHGGSVGLEYSYYLHDPQFAGQSSDSGKSLFVRPEASWRSSSGDHQLRLVGFGRVDSLDDERSHADVREAYWRWSSERWQVLAGVNQVFWGVAESRHLVDVINQVDWIEDPDQEEKLGQPMLEVSTQRDWGELSVFLLPYFRERAFPGAEGRFRTPLPVATKHARYESNDRDRHLDVAARYSHYIGDWDIGVHFFKGTSREPWLEYEDGYLIPVYDQMTQLGVDLQHTREAWLYKAELLGREGRGGSFAAAVVGFEYTLYQIADSEKDLGLLVEYLYDGRGDGFATTAFDNDIFLGSRLAFNDSQDTAALFGVVYDQHTKESFFNLEAERRLGQSVKVELDARLVAGADRDEPLYSFARDDHLRLRFSYFFN